MAQIALTCRKNTRKREKFLLFSKEMVKKFG